MAVYTKEYESQTEAILTNVIICPAVDLSANVVLFIAKLKMYCGTQERPIP